MKFDLTKIDFQNEITDQLKKQYFEIIDKMVRKNVFDNKENRIITMFHGTNLDKLNSILINGLLPRDTTGLSNYENELESNQNLVYLTNRWHYFYAYKACHNQDEIKQNTLNIPCYIECEVPAYKLLLDEDFFHSLYLKRKIQNVLKQRKSILEISYKECIDMYGTVAHIGKVPIENIKSFTILANDKILQKNFIDPRSKYMQQLTKWSKGNGVGTIKLNDLFYLEDDEYNVTFWTKDIPQNHIITGIEQTENSNVKYRLILKEIKKIPL